MPGFSTTCATRLPPDGGDERTTTGDAKHALSVECYHAFKLRHEQHPQGELIHYVGSPCSVEEIEARLAKNSVTHVLVEKQWKRVSE